MSAFGNLSAPLKVHQQHARKSLTDFQDHLHRFENSFNQGDCVGAHNELVSMAIDVGEIDEAVGDSNADLSIDMNLTLLDVSERFKDACVRTTPGGRALNGLKRRRRW